MSAPSGAPVYMSQERMGEYLHDLRHNRPQRPTGARPCPTGSIRNARQRDYAFPSRKSSISTVRTEYNGGVHSRKSSASSRRQSWAPTVHSRKSSMEIPIESRYAESDRRQKEKLEARMMRMALEDIDRGQQGEVDDDQVEADARAEADDLMRRHAQPDYPYRLDEEVPPVPPIPPRLRNLSAEVAPLRFAAAPRSDDTLPQFRKRGDPGPGPNALPTPQQRRRSSGQKRSGSGKYQGVFSNPEDKIYEDPVEDEDVQMISSPRRKVSDAPRVPPEVANGVQAISSVPSYVRKNPFARAQAARQSRAEQPYRLPHRVTRPSIDSTIVSADRQTPTQSGETTPAESPSNEAIGDDAGVPRFKNGVEVRSDDLRAATSFSLRNRSPKLPSPVAVSDSSRRPIVSFKPDWKPSEVEEVERPAAASPRQRPSPTIQRVRDLEHEPIKSSSAPAVPTLRFPGPPSSQVNNGRLVEEAPTDQRSNRISVSAFPPPPTPSINVAPAPVVQVPEEVPQIPTIKVSETKPAIPVINVSETQPPIPAINVYDELSSSEPRPLPTISFSTPPNASEGCQTKATPNRAPRPPAVHASTAPVAPRATYSFFPAIGRRTTALCSQCGLPISGKIVTAAGVRFHPGCFSCHTCKTQLECVDFYPEPENRRIERFERIQRRLVGEQIPGEQEDGDDGLRFYCHLDFHEHFSPRCKSCKTPIEGEVVVACGAEWHVGHFFCAECGDPFDPTTPFVEKDGYAWCIRCHTNRYSTKCKKCRKPVTDMVLRALDAEWHEDCFTCTMCDGPFEDGRYFLVGSSDDPICFPCQDRRLKS